MNELVFRIIGSLIGMFLLDMVTKNNWKLILSPRNIGINVILAVVTSCIMFFFFK